jgi:hypothetical protein
LNDVPAVLSGFGRGNGKVSLHAEWRDAGVFLSFPRTRE